MELSWTEQADADLANIVDFIARDNVQAALEMEDRLKRVAEGLIPFPHAGKPGRVPGTREFLAHEHYYLVYTVKTDAVFILSVLHTSRQWP